ncbi:MAG: hypothetical protein ACJ764_04445 [Solirubrobacteraceae bacterium]
MAKTLDPILRVGSVVFELDRFELVGGDTYTVQGRWFGVRGRRFIRPTLTALVEDHSVRVLADLEHKPWAAEDGQPWEAVFSSRQVDGKILQAELAVAPDLLITLPSPGEPTGGEQTTLPAGADAESRRRGARQEKPGLPRGKSAPSQEAPPAAPDTPDADRLSALTRDLAKARKAERDLRHHLDRAQAQKAEAAARMDEVLGNLSRAMRERDDAQAARDEALAEREELGRERDHIKDERDAARREGAAVADERDQIAAQREAALRDRDEASQARERALASRDHALQTSEAGAVATDEALGQRSAALEAQTQAQTERDAALASLAQAELERDGALTARDHAVGEQESLRTTVDRLQSELAHQASTHGAAMVMRRAVQEPPFYRPHPRVVSRALAIIGLLAVVVVLLIVLQVV